MQEHLPKEMLMYMKRVAAVVVTYNRKDILLTCLEHLASVTVPDQWQLDILVIDNASTDGTEQALALLLNKDAIRYFNTGSNLGGAGGFNYGMRVAAEEGYDYVWVMDDDCLPDTNALQAFVDADATLNQQWGYLSSVVRWTDGSPCAMNIQRHPLFANITDFSPEVQPCTLASFVSLLVPTSILYELGLPIAEFFIWTDDWEFTRRISRKYPCYVVGGSTVVHASATNSPGTIYTDGADRLDRYQYIYRNDVVLYRDEGIRGKAFLVVRALYHMLRVVFSGTDQKSKRLRLIVQGTREGRSFHPVIEFPAAQE